MITGIVSPNLQATLRLHIADGAGQTQAIDVIVDTGFSDFMSLPIATVASLALAKAYQEDVRLADGRIIRVTVHTTEVIWDGRPRRIEVHALGLDQMIGMRMLAAHDLSIRVIDGGPVRIDAAP